MRLINPSTTKAKKIGYVAPTKDDVRLLTTGRPLDFSNGIEMDDIPRSIISLLEDQNFRLPGETALALFGKGCVEPHIDCPIYEDTLTMVWLAHSTRRAHLMVENQALLVNVGDILLIDESKLHAWVTNGSWAMLVADIASIDWKN